jgi:rod shape-determining protein MreC
MTGNGWKMARARGSLTAQLPLAICFVLAIVITLLGRAEASIFDTARARLTDWSAPALGEIRKPFAALEGWVSGWDSLWNTHRENLQLRAENAELRKWQYAALALEQRVKRYELMLNAVPNPELDSTMAHVIGQSNRPFIKTMILNGGTEHGIAKGQAVVDDRGLIGRVYLAGERTSWVIPLGDHNSRVPVVVKPSNRRAILAGDNTISPLLQLDVGETKVNPGDRVYSTGDGGLLPADLPIGVVILDRGILRVALFANPDLSDYVHVVHFAPSIEPPATADSELPAPYGPVTRAPGPAAGEEVAGTAPSLMRNATTLASAGAATERGE